MTKQTQGKCLHLHLYGSSNHYQRLEQTDYYAAALEGKLLGWLVF